MYIYLEMRLVHPVEQEHFSLVHFPPSLLLDLSFIPILLMSLSYVIYHSSHSGFSRSVPSPSLSPFRKRTLAASTPCPAPLAIQRLSTLLTFCRVWNKKKKKVKRKKRKEKKKMKKEYLRGQ
jgi:hypothetical protein